MSKHFFRMAFAIGLIAIAWVGLGYAGSDWFAFAMCAAIAGTYLLGANELRQYRAQSTALAAALADDAAPPADLGEWLQRVPPALRGSVRHRLEEGRGGLPGPALTPYLVGLLVMLGMLGTFLGLVVTFRGAVFALEGSTDLQAIRAALAEPIRGLGMAFGASVAGVAASAMLGLMSAIARRERVDAARLLDARAATVLRPFSLAHQREQALRAAQAQADLLPAVAGQLEALMERIEERSRQLDARLLESQAKFHREASAAYAGLARDVGASLQQSLAAGAQAAGESIRPALESAMARIAQDAQALHARVGEAAEAQVDTLSRQFGATARTISDGWQSALQAQARNDAERLQAWTDRLQAMAAGLDAQWARAAERADAQAGRTLEQVSRLLAQSEALVRAREETEARWLQQHGERMDAIAQQHGARMDALVKQEDERMDALAGVWRTQLEALRAEEQRRGDAAVARLGELQAALAQQLGTLGAALETPLARLLQTASEVPQAAAGVLAQLRQEMSRLAAQENAALQERTVLVERLAALMRTVEDASRQAAEVAAHASANAVELGAWGEAFSQSVQLFHAGNEKLVATLQQVEGAVTRSTARSDEQLAYYVAQAREVIDLSIASQHGVIEKLRDMAGKPAGIVTTATGTRG
jgi:hypothetical protein